MYIIFFSTINRTQSVCTNGHEWKKIRGDLFYSVTKMCVMMQYFSGQFCDSQAHTMLCILYVYCIVLYSVLCMQCTSEKMVYDIY